MIEIFVPALLIAYLEAFRVAFNKPGYTYFIGFIWALMLIPGHKRVTDIANYLCAEDATFAGKASKKMLGVQKWKDHSGNPDRGGYLFGHNWAILGLLSPFRGRWLCFPILARLIPWQKNPSLFVSTPKVYDRRTSGT